MAREDGRAVPGHVLRSLRPGPEHKPEHRGKDRLDHPIEHDHMVARHGLGCSYQDRPWPRTLVLRSVRSQRTRLAHDMVRVAPIACDDAKEAQTRAREDPRLC